MLKKNPISDDVFPESEETPRDIYLQPEKVTEIILTAAKNKRTRHIARALQYYFLVPCRKSEVIRMRLADIDRFNWKIRVYNGTTKNERGVWKPIPPSMIKWFKRRLKEAKSQDEPIFCRRIIDTGEIKPLGDFKNAWKTVRKDCGVSHLHLHDSRHISATNLINQGTPRTVVNEVANWKTDMLKDYYHSDSDVAYRFIKWPEAPKCEGGVKAEQAANS